MADISWLLPRIKLHHSPFAFDYLQFSTTSASDHLERIAPAAIIKQGIVFRYEEVDWRYTSIQVAPWKTESMMSASQGSLFAFRITQNKIKFDLVMHDVFLLSQ